MKVLSVNVVMTYPVHWTKYQVLRDFTQNFYDAVDHDHWRQRLCYEYADNSLSMWLNYETFNYEWVMHIGTSKKRTIPISMQVSSEKDLKLLHCVLFEIVIGRYR